MQPIEASRASLLARELTRGNFSNYIRRVFGVVSPSHEYVHGWHIDAIAEYLAACEAGEIKNLVINIPPRCLKTIMISVGWSTWLLGHNPSAQILAASYSSDLAHKDSLASRNVMQAQWYRDCFPQTELDIIQAAKLTTTQRGHRLATSVGGTILGQGGDFLILDDPIKAEEAKSDTVRNKTNEWIDTAFMTRKNDIRTACAVLIMQRLHEKDASGHLIERGWDSLVLPAQFSKRTIVEVRGKRWEMNAGDFLMPERLGKEELEQKRRDLGEYGYAAQFLQNPAPIGGGLVKRSWFRAVENMPLAYDYIVHSWDTASKAGVLNDCSACTVWGVKQNGYYLIDVLNERLEFPDLKRAVLRLAERDSPKYILIEEKASGLALIQDLRNSARLPIKAIVPVHDKVTRFAGVTTEFETGQVIIPLEAKWAENYISQLTTFPNGAHDDMVDSTSQFLLWAKENAKRIKPPKERDHQPRGMTGKNAWMG